MPPLAPAAARALWRVLEPVHEVCYGTPESVQALTEIGLDEPALRYFGSRAAALGPVPSSVVAACFYSFDPQLVATCIPRAWERAGPAEIVAARLAGADEALRRVLGPEVIGSHELHEAAALARAAVEACNFAGRPLGAAHAPLEWPDDDHLVLWLAATALREHRGDGHVAALMVAGLDGCESHVLHAADGHMAASALRRLSGWSHEAWAEAEHRLTARGLVELAGGATDTGKAEKAAVEHRTDRLALGPWRELGAERTVRLRQLVQPWATAILEAGAAPGWRRREERWRDLDDERRFPRLTSRAGTALLDEDVNETGLLRVLVVTKGHPFQSGPFFAMFDDNEEITWSHVEHPAAQALLNPQGAAGIDVFVLYDMPGITFEAGVGPRYQLPPERLVAGMHRLLRSGKGFVFIHHALGGWPAWPEYHEMIGGQFLYAPEELRGRRFPDSGYHHDVRHHLSVVDPTHPVCEGLADGFDVTDEVFLCPVFERSVVPLLRSDAMFNHENFYSAAAAVQGRPDDNSGWWHPPGTSMVAWAHSWGTSPIVYIQPGDGPPTYENPAYRRLLANAIRWVGSPDAKAWASDR